MDEEQIPVGEGQGPVDYFKNLVRDWWNRVMELEKERPPKGSELAAQQNALLKRAKTIRATVEKIPGMSAIFGQGDLGAFFVPAALVAGGVAASIVGAIKLWDRANEQFRGNMEIYRDSCAMGISPEKASEIAFGDTKRAGNWFKILPWAIIGLGAIYWFGYRKANTVKRLRDDG
jgi:hypothetical protein